IHAFCRRRRFVAIRLECPGCQSKLTIPEELQGKQVRCPKCSKPTLVPGAAGKVPAPKTSPSTDIVAVQKQPTRPSEAVAKSPTAPASAKKTRNEDEEAKSAKKRRPQREYRDEEDSE